MTGMNGKTRASFVTDWQFVVVLLALLPVLPANTLLAALSGGHRGGAKKGGGIGGSGVQPQPHFQLQKTDMCSARVTVAWRAPEPRFSVCPVRHRPRA